MNANDWEAAREAVGFISDPLERLCGQMERQLRLLERLAVAIESSNERHGEIVDALVALGVTLEGRS